MTDQNQNETVEEAATVESQSETTTPARRQPRAECDCCIAEQLRVRGAEKSFQMNDARPLLEMIQNDPYVWCKLSYRDIKWGNRAAILTMCKSEKHLPLDFESEKSWKENASAILQQDREIFLLRLSLKNRYWRDADRETLQIPSNLLDDEEVVSAAVKMRPELLSLQSHTIHTDLFNNSLSVLLAFTNGLAALPKWQLAHLPSRPKFSDILLFSPSIRSDPDLAIRAINPHHRIPDDALTYFLDPVKNHRPAVLQFLKRNGLCLKDAADEFKDDEELVRVACSRNDPYAILYASHGVLKRVFSDKSFCSNLVTRCGFASPGGISMTITSADHQTNVVFPSKKLALRFLFQWLAPDRVQSDVDIVIKSLKSGFLQALDIPSGLLNDQAFCMQVIPRYPLFWLDLSDEMKLDETLARAAITACPSVHLARGVFDIFPGLRHDRDFWIIIIGSGGNSYLPEILQTFAPPSIRNDVELMKTACGNVPRVMRILNEELQRNVEVLQALYSSGYGFWEYIPHDVQIENRDLIATFSADAYNGSYLAPALLHDPSFVVRWLAYPKEDWSFVPESLRHNEDVALAFAKIIRDSDDRNPLDDSFKVFVPVELRSNKRFMKKVLEVTKSDEFLRTVEGDLFLDLDFTIFGLSAIENGECFLLSLEVDRVPFFRKVLAVAKERIEAHRSFVKGFLPGVKAYGGPKCFLMCLAQDEATSTALLGDIAEFAGVPTDEELARLIKTVKILDPLDCYCGCCWSPGS